MKKIFLVLLSFSLVFSVATFESQSGGSSSQSGEVSPPPPIQLQGPPASESTEVANILNNVNAEIANIYNTHKNQVNNALNNINIKIANIVETAANHQDTSGLANLSANSLSETVSNIRAITNESASQRSAAALAADNKIIKITYGATDNNKQIAHIIYKANKKMQSNVNSTTDYMYVTLNQAISNVTTIINNNPNYQQIDVTAAGNIAHTIDTAEQSVIIKFNGFYSSTDRFISAAENKISRLFQYNPQSQQQQQQPVTTENSSDNWSY